MTQYAAFFWQQNRGNVQGWGLSLLFHGVFVGATVLMMTNVMEVKKPEPIRLDMALLKPPPKPIQQFQPVHKTVVAQQRVERQEFKKEVSKKEIVVNKIEETNTWHEVLKPRTFCLTAIGRRAHRHWTQPMWSGSKPSGAPLRCCLAKETQEA